MVRRDILFASCLITIQVVCFHTKNKKIGQKGMELEFGMSLPRPKTLESFIGGVV